MASDGTHDAESPLPESGQSIHDDPAGSGETSESGSTVDREQILKSMDGESHLSRQQASANSLPADPVEAQQIERLKRWFHLDNSTPVIKVLVTANIVVFLAMVLYSGFESILMPSVDTLLDWGALYAPSTLYGQVWRMFSSLFLHAGVIHLGLNMYVLWYVGPLVERLFGSWKFLVLYLLAGLGGALSTLLWTPAAVGVGASGAIFGIFGALLAFFQVHKRDFPPGMFKQKIRGLMAFLLINLAFGLVQPNIGLAAHIGGLCTGYVVAVAIIPRSPNDLSWHWRDSLGVALVILACAALFQMERMGALDFGGELSLVRAADFIKSGKYAQALPLLEKRIELTTDDRRAYAVRAAAYTMMKEYRKAIEDCDRILSLDPKNVQALLGRADVYAKLGDYQKAVDDIGLALELKPKVAGAYSARAWDQMMLGRYQQGIADYLKALEIRPESTSLYNSLTFADFAAGDYKGAITNGRKLLEKAGWEDEFAPYAVILSALSQRLLGDQPGAQKTLEEGL